MQQMMLNICLSAVQQPSATVKDNFTSSEGSNIQHIQELLQHLSLFAKLQKCVKFPCVCGECGVKHKLVKATPY